MCSDLCMIMSMKEQMDFLEQKLQKTQLERDHAVATAHGLQEETEKLRGHSRLSYIKNSSPPINQLASPCSHTGMLIVQNIFVTQ